MEKQEFTKDLKLYIGIFILALGIRLLNLGVAPLSDFEASWALQSWQATQHSFSDFGSNPGYALPTNFLFYLFGAGNGIARFWPALVGSGVTSDNIDDLWAWADGVIVGTAIKENGVTASPVDPARAAAFVKAARS